MPGWHPVLGGAVAGLGVVLAGLAAHPFTSYPASLAVLARLRPQKLRPLPDLAAPSVAICVCAYNEATVIAAKAENLLAMQEACPGLEILVYVDADTDGTAEILSAYTDRLRLVVSNIRHGKTYGMNLLVGMTQADIVVFTDANVSFAPDAIPRLVAPFADPQIGAVCGHLIYVGAPEAQAQNATAQTGSLYWRLEEKIKALESATGSVMGADGSIFAIRRALHQPPPADLIDDMFVSFSVLCDGSRIVRAADALAYEASVSQSSQEFRRKIRIACQAFNVHRRLRHRLRRLPPIDRYKYVSHKLLRWFAIYLLGAGAVCFLGGLALAGQVFTAGLLLIAGLALLAGMRLAQRGPLATLGNILGAFLATGIGIWRSLQGERFQTWNPPASARLPARATAAPAPRRSQDQPTEVTS